MSFKKRLANIILSAVLISSMVVTPVFAEPATPETPAEAPAEEAPAQNVPDERGHYSMEYTHDIAPDSNSFSNWPQGPLINSESAILMDMDTGAVLYAKNAYKRQFPASITKLLTVLVALDYVSMDDEVEFTQASIDFLRPGDAHIAMQPGEIISMEDALYAVLFASANEVSYAVGESVGKKYLNGGYEEFLAKMNEKSLELGCKDSHWTNTNGLHNEEHYTTAYDMGLISAAIYKKPEFNTMMEQFQHEIPPTNLVDEPRVFQQHHKMTWQNGKYFYEGCKGGKTGFTDDAQTTLVTLAEKNGVKLAAVLLYDRGGQAYPQTKELLDYGFENFHKVSVGENADVQEYEMESPSLLLPDGVTMDSLVCTTDAVENDERLGKLNYTYNDNLMGTLNVKLTKEAYKRITGVDTEKNETVEKEQKDNIDVSDQLQKAMKLSFIVVVSLIVIVLIVFFIRLAQYKKKKRRKKLAAKKRQQALAAKKRREEQLRKSKKKTRR